jgi:hypothetical protein
VESTTDPWPEILKLALAASSSLPALGTHFREATIKVAIQHGTIFPPDAEPRLRFIQLLERYPEVVRIRRRSGQDFLVASAASPETLAKGVQGQSYGIRQDLFQAFTAVSENRAFYDPNEDRIAWHDPAETGLNASLIPIDPATEETEIQLRREFADLIDEHLPARSRLAHSLTNPSPFLEFSKVIRESALQREWHNFRTERVVGRIQSWAKQRNVAWRDAWLTTSLPHSPRKAEQLVISTHGDHVSHDPLLLLFSRLDAADVQRITIPLDLVLKALSPQKS